MASSRSELVSFEAVASDEVTEVFLIDASLARIASGVGRVKEKLAPGLYKVRFRSGASQHDELVEVTPSPQAQVLQGASVPFSSAAPIKPSRSYEAGQAEAARRLSLGTRRSPGRGELFVFLRSEDPDNDFDAEGISILTLNGEPVSTLARGEVDSASRYAGLALSLDGGSYRIRVHTPDLGGHEIFVTVCKGWQTQVFLATEIVNHGADALLIASLRRASVFMCRTGEGFNPAAERYRLTELAQKALAQGRSKVSRGFLDRVLYGKFDDPIMGLIAAHLILQGRHNDRRSLSEKILDNVGSMLGCHPDLIGLRFGRNPSDAALRDVTLTQPPLLSASWRYLTRATRRRAGLIGPDSVPGQIAHNISSGGPWLIYRVRDREGANADSISLAEADERFASLLRLYGDRLAEISKMQHRKDTRFSGLEQSLLTLMQSETQKRELRALSDRHSSKSDPRRQLRRIKAPAYSVAAAVAGLEGKLTRLLG